MFLYELYMVIFLGMTNIVQVWRFSSNGRIKF